MTYVTKSCPHCGRKYSVHQPSKAVHYGSPFRRCQYCGKGFVDKDFREIAVSGVRSIDRQRVAPGTILLSIFPVFFLVVGLWSGISAGFDSTAQFLIGLGAVFTAICAYLIISEARGHDDFQRFLAEETKRSEARLRNPEYALALKQLGYKVPEQYLPHK